MHIIRLEDQEALCDTLKDCFSICKVVDCDIRDLAQKMKEGK